jgi:transposase-like protein
VNYLPQMADENRRRYLFVAIGRATRWVFIRIFKAKTAANARRFLRDLERACPIRIRTILTPSHGLQANHCRAMDNGKEFTDRLFGLRKRAATAGVGLSPILHRSNHLRICRLLGHVGVE